VRDGEPVFSPPPSVEQDFKPGCHDDGHPPGTCTPDFVLKGEIVELFAELDRLGDAVIVKLEIKGGLPFKITVSALGLL
jgi:hypothetical protein